MVHISEVLHVFTPEGRGCGCCGGVCVRGVGSPTSLGGLSLGRLRIITSRAERTILGHIDGRNNRIKPGLKFIRTAITLRCIFSTPGSGLIFSMDRRYCPRGILAKQTTKFLNSISSVGTVSNCSSPTRYPRCSGFRIKRASASIDLTANLRGTHSIGNASRGVVTVVNSNSLSNNRTFRKLSRTSRLNANVVVIIGSGRVSVTRGRNKVCGGLHTLHRDGNAYRRG